ncbi:MAG: sodium/proline symporter [Candidatus Rhabdochlamydia sp.]
MYTFEFLAIVLYISILLLISYASYQKHLSSNDFIIGSRSLNSSLTALSAHASDMSSWLFLAYPALVFSQGMLSLWTAIGLIFCMFLNWQLIAPRIRVKTEQFESLTLSSFFEHRLQDSSGVLRLFSALILIVFYTIYISAFLIGLGDLLVSLFPLHYSVAILLGISTVIPYVFSGGFVTLAWIDLFQGVFLLLVILFIPSYLMTKISFQEIMPSLTLYHRSPSLFPDFSPATLISILSLSLGWGLGYFGQPHIITKFMGIKEVKKISQAKWIGMGWMTLSLGGATLIGLLGISFFQGSLANPETLFIQIVKGSFSSFFVGLILCAVLGATMNAMSSQILVLSSTLSEDFYKRFINPLASSQKLLRVSRMGVILSCSMAYFIAYHKFSSIYILVNYAWSGIGASFGPLLLLSLYSKQLHKYGAWAGILGGGLFSGVWPFLNPHITSYTIAPLLPAFFFSLILIIFVSFLCKKSSPPQNLSHKDPLDS